MDNTELRYTLTRTEDGKYAIRHPNFLFFPKLKTAQEAIDIWEACRMNEEHPLHVNIDHRTPAPAYPDMPQ